MEFIPFKLALEVHTLKVHVRYQLVCYLVLFARCAYQIYVDFYYENASPNWLYVSLVFSFLFFQFLTIYGILKAERPYALWKLVFLYLILNGVFIVFLGHFLYLNYTSVQVIDPNEFRHFFYSQVVAVLIVLIVTVYLKFMEFQALILFFKLIRFCQEQQWKKNLAALKDQKGYAEKLNSYSSHEEIEKC
uniref:Uncharacterized protein n=1 Tax=Acrobeloides nanus TaxID=290746 RepID=A0A914DUD0_9BILA